MSSGHTTESVLQGLVHPLRLAVGLRMIARGETHRRPQGRAERPPHPGHKLRTPVRHNVSRDSMEPEHMLYQKVPHFGRQRKFMERHEMHRLGEAVDDGEDHGVTVGWRETCDEVHSDMGPRAAWCGEGVQKA